jgi:hypothetical protein
MTISTEILIDESLHDAVTAFIDGHPAWDNDRVVSAALRLFLRQLSQMSQVERDGNR